jgi:membrane associated rhomboid family serine protease
MKNSILHEVKYSVFQSGNPLYQFIAINVGVFLLLNLLFVVEFLAGQAGVISNQIQAQLSVPTQYAELATKPWTLFTYMFTQREFFHLLFNMLWLFWLGNIFLDFLNKRQFIFSYILGGLAGGLAYLLIYNYIPVFKNDVQFSYLLGSSASVMAIVVGTATLLPDYSIRMLFFGNVKLKYLALVFIILDLIGIAGANPGGSLSHLGGALFGFLFISQLQKGKDWSKIFIRKKKPKFQVARNEEPRVSPTVSRTIPNQEYIDTILDKISQSGYDKLTKEEKEALFKASKQDQN